MFSARLVKRERERGKKFRHVRDFDVFVLYSAADTKNLNGRDRKKAAEGEHAWTVGPTVALARRLCMSTRNRHVRRDEKQSRRFPHLGRRLCYAVANFKLFARRFAHLVHETK